jgi:hydroxyacylglutathione hydrolase
MSDQAKFSMVPIPAFNDNYIWAICHGSACTVVDPGDAAPVIEFLQEQGLQLHSILITHHHADHVGGLKTLLSHYTVPVYGPKGGHIDGISTAVGEADKLEVVGHFRLQVIAVPGHTLDHIAYFGNQPDDDSPVLFCGDTLFAGGCGRIFEGTPEMMYQSLQRLSTLPGNTRVYCAHEYTLKNLEFASLAEPQNTVLHQRIEAETAKRSKHLPTLPSTIELELRTNPFLRCHNDSLKQRVIEHSSAEINDVCSTFAALRHWKDNA